MTRDAELKARDFVALVMRGVGAETEVGVAQRLLMQAQSALNSYAEPHWALTRGWPAFADRLLELARAAEPGSDHQLAYTNALCSSVLSAHHLVLLADLLDRDPAECGLAGLDIDTDLRWEVLEGLALNGATDAVVIDAALEKDNTSNGQQAAARAHATFPTPEAKRAAFDSLVSKDDLPNVIVRNVTMGYLHTNDPSSLSGLIEPYFAMLNDIWTTRSYKIAEYVVLGLYPAPLASQELVDATNAWLAANPDVPALRRLVVENLAGVERALRAQARDRA